jgi:hypothetical protein
MHIYVKNENKDHLSQKHNAHKHDMKIKIKKFHFPKQNAYKHTSSWRLSKIVKSCKGTNVLPMIKLMTQQQKKLEFYYCWKRAHKMKLRP